MSILTKKGLAVSFKKLACEKSINKITVTEIVNDCGIRRQTFYYHFKDIYDLINWIYETEALSYIKKYDTWQEGLLNFLYYVWDSKEFCLSCFYSLDRDYAENKMYIKFFHLIQHVLKKTDTENILDREQRKFITNFYTYAFIGVLVGWLKSGLKEEPKVLVEKISFLVVGNFETIIEKFNTNK